jgi:uncharacterized protein (TIGR04255 family)
MPPPLPEFELPPLDEVALAVHFQPLKAFHTAHHGLFWSTINDRFPTTESQAPAFTLIEQADFRPQRPMIEFGPVPALSRSWFLDQTGNNLIQIQNDLFARNWRKLQGEESYPRFPHLLAEFRRDWQAFSSFIQKEGLGDIRIIQCELTYINHIERGAGRESLENLSEVFSSLRPPDQGAFLPAPEMFSWEAKYKLPDERGRLSIEVKPIFRGRDMKIVLLFQLIARGKPGGQNNGEIATWFELAHEWIVRGFHQLTSDQMHRLWKEKL